ncbi:hypothetical protein CRT60_16430 [Azospirillum palustre]|uniref:HTH cro/C1-type domain-containing protein n=1 Tax=Azospirillum palustre TaxID=2044885 RepID=A0A2B8BG25_9PROT|nr:hypothetical protein [Azospirillum palustre]PGH56508.1 hypothetical protein CRT60_16430 [Azospirillum palustre]
MKADPITPAGLRARLAELNLRPADLARMVGRSPAAVSLWLSGRRRIPVYVVRFLDQHAELRFHRAATWRRAAADAGAKLEAR